MKIMRNNNKKKYNKTSADQNTQTITDFKPYLFTIKSKIV